MDVAEQIYGAIDILVNERLRSINFNTTIDATIVDASRAKEGRYKVKDETARTFIAYSNQTDYKENDNVLVTIPNGDYTEQKIIIGKKVGGAENTTFKYTSPLSTMIPIVRCTLSGDQREYHMWANQDERILTTPILQQDFSNNPIMGYTRLGLTADFSSWLKELNTIEGSYGIVCTCAFSKKGLAGDEENQDLFVFEPVTANESFDKSKIYYTYNTETEKYVKAYIDENAFQQDITYYTHQLKPLEANKAFETAQGEFENTVSNDNNLEDEDASGFEFVNFLLDSNNDFYGDVYNFQDYFSQEAVFDISKYSEQKLLYILVSFYQRQNFKDTKGNYIPAPTFNETDLKVALLNYKNNGNESGATYDAQTQTETIAAKDLIEYYGFDGEEDNGHTFSTIVNVDEDEDFVSIIQNLYVREPQVILGYNLGDFEDNSIFLFSQDSSTYSTAKTDDQNKKLVELRWIHDFNGDIKVVTKDDFTSVEMKDYQIRWYRYKLGEPSPDTYAGIYWDSAGIYSGGTNYDDDPIFQQELIPNPKLDYEQMKVIILKKNKVIATSNIILFENEKETENLTQTDLFKALNIACGRPSTTADELQADRFWRDKYQGMFYIYKKGNQLIDDTKALEKMFLTPTFNSAKEEYQPSEEYIGNDVVMLAEAYCVVWSFPASDTMLRPTYQQGGIGSDLFPDKKNAGSTPVSTDTYPFFANAACTRYLLDSFVTAITNENIQGYVFYNSTLDTYEFAYVSRQQPDGLILDLANPLKCGVIQQYYIEKMYKPTSINNTVEVDVIKDRTRYHASKTLYFGQSGTSGSDYTLVVNFRNNQNAVSVAAGDPIYGENEELIGYAAENYFGTDNYNALIASVRLIGQDGKDAIDFERLGSWINPETNEEETNENFTVSFDWALSQVDGYTGTTEGYRAVPLEMADIYYPVFFSDQDGRSGLMKQYQNFTQIEEKGLSDTDYLVQKLRPSQVGDDTFPLDNFEGYYYFSLEEINDNIGATITSGQFVALEDENLPTNYEHYQLYRKLTPSEARKPKFTYKKFSDVSEEWYANLNGPAFINYGGIYILDPFFETTGYNEAQDYYYPVFVDASIDNFPALAVIQDSEQLAEQNIILNPRHECLIAINPFWLGEENVENPIHLTQDEIMNSISVLQVTLSGFGNYDLVTQIPIPLRRVVEQNNTVINWVQSIVGATEIRYSSSGEVPDYYKNPYIAKIVNDDAIEEQENNNWSIISPLLSEDYALDGFLPDLTSYTQNGVNRSILQPLSLYIPDAPAFGVQYHLDNPNSIVLWTQPILVYQDNYPSATINAWDGTSIKTDDDTGSIISSAIAAGKKNSENKFSGVMLGDWSRTDTDSSISKQTGLYGFHEGAMSFAFKEDGTGFIGKDGSGRIHLAGDKAQIYSSAWILRQQGMLLDIDDGIMKLVNKKNINYQSITITNPQAQLTESSGIYYYEPYKPTDRWSYNANAYLPTSFIKHSAYNYELKNNGSGSSFYNSGFWYIGIEDAADLNTNLSVNDGYIDVMINNVVVENVNLPETQRNAISNAPSNQFSFKDEQTYTLKKVYVKLSQSQEDNKFYISMIDTDSQNHEGYDGPFEVLVIKQLQIKFRKVSSFGDTGLVEKWQRLYQDKEIAYFAYQCIDSDYFYHWFANSHTNEVIYSKNGTYTGRAWFFRRDGYKSISSTSASISNDLKASNSAHLGMYFTPHAQNNGYRLWSETRYNYDPDFTYYIAPGESDAKYITMSVKEQTYPLSIGLTKYPSSRRFKVDWEGRLYATDGEFSGTIHSDSGEIGGWSIGPFELSAANGSVTLNSQTGILSGATIITDQGYIGGWSIDEQSLYGGNTMLHSSDGIFTDNIKIKATNANWNSYFGGMGYVGADFTIDDDETKEPGVALYYGTSAISSPAIYKVNKRNLGFKWYGSYMSLSARTEGNATNVTGSTEKVWTFDGNNNTNFNLQHMRTITIASAPTVSIGTITGTTYTVNDIYIRAKKIHFETPTASDQTGIYARFA